MWYFLKRYSYREVLGWAWWNKEEPVTDKEGVEKVAYLLNGFLLKQASLLSVAGSRTPAILYEARTPGSAGA